MQLLFPQIQKYKCNSRESDCILGKYSTYKSWALVELIIPNEEESKSETSTTTTSKLSDDSGDKCDVIFYHKKNLEQRITKSNQALMSHLTMQWTSSKKIWKN